jgi:hypothetical protein
MPGIKIKIATDNAAFEEDPETEVARILRELASRLEAGDHPSSIRDLNGNKVGTIEYWDA